MGIVEKLQDGYYSWKIRRVLTKLEKLDTSAQKKGAVSETQVNFLEQTPDLQALYEQIAGMYGDDDREGATEILKELSTQQLVAMGRMFAKENEAE